jgi:hypothetical protein
MIGESVCDFFVEGPIRNSRRRGGTGVRRPEHDPEKWKPVFRKDAQTKSWSMMSIPPNDIMLWRMIGKAAGPARRAPYERGSISCWPSPAGP